MIGKARFAGVLISVCGLAVSSLVALAGDPVDAAAQGDAAEASKAVAREGAGAQVWQGEVSAGGAKLGFVVRLVPGLEGKPASGSLDIPAQGVKDSALKDIVIGEKELRFTFTYPGTPDAVFELKIDEADAAKASGTLSQAGASFPTTASKLKEGEEPKGPDRPQHPKPPYPYEARAMSFVGGAEGVTLGGTLTMPKDEGPFPAVVLVSGSGPQDRDETLMGHKPFLVLADALTKAGVAVLRYDDRGVGASTGDFATATTDDFANDAEKAVAALAGEAKIDAKKIGIIGHSEGGLIAPIVAARNDGVAFIVMLAGPGTDGKETLRDQLRAIQIANGVPGDNADEQVKIQQQLLQDVIDGAVKEKLDAGMRRLMAVQSGEINPSDELMKQVPQDVVDNAVGGLVNPWMKRFLVLDPRESLRKVKVPVLALNGEMDTQVLASINLPEVRKALQEAGNKDVTLLGINNVNHLFQTCQTGSPAEYAQISETFSPAALEKIATWVRQRTGLEAMPAAAKLPEGQKAGD